MSPQHLENYVSERLVVDPHGRVRASALYADYLAWVDGRAPVLGDVALTSSQFGRRAAAYGLHRGRDKAGRYYAGIRLRRPS